MKNIGSNLLNQLRSQPLHYVIEKYRDERVPNQRSLFSDIFYAVKFDGGCPFDLDINIDPSAPLPYFPFDQCYFEFQNESGRANLAYSVSYDVITVFVRSVMDDNWCVFPCVVRFLRNTEEPKIHIKWVYPELKNRNFNLGESISVEQILYTKVTEIVNFLHVMNCSNVEVIDNNKVRRKVNIKRINKKKLPIFEHKTLHIRTNKTQEKSENQTRTHDSPRVHLRRGHIRKLSSGKEIWVSACVVGDREKGIVGKDYVVHHD